MKTKGFIEFEKFLIERSKSMSLNGETCYPFMAGYMLSFISQLAEEVPGVEERLKIRAKEYYDSLDQQADEHAYNSQFN